MQIAFLDASTDRSAFAARHASEVRKFRDLLQPVAPGLMLHDFRVTEGEFPPGLAGFDGIMVSGSPASVNDPDAWVARLLALIRAAVAAELPVFGACFGHQAVAKALGGVVGRNPGGWVLGRVEVATLQAAAWMDGAAPLVLHAAHGEQVLTPPPGARVLGAAPGTPLGHLALGARVFTTQYHPEITAAVMADLVEDLDGRIAPDAIARARASLPGPQDGPRMARWIAGFFAQAAD